MCLSVCVHDFFVSRFWRGNSVNNASGKPALTCQHIHIRTHTNIRRVPSIQPGFSLGCFSQPSSSPDTRVIYGSGCCLTHTLLCTEGTELCACSSLCFFWMLPQQISALHAKVRRQREDEEIIRRSRGQTFHHFIPAPVDVQQGLWSWREKQTSEEGTDTQGQFPLHLILLLSHLPRSCLHCVVAWEHGRRISRGLRLWFMCEQEWVHWEVSPGF